VSGQRMRAVVKYAIDATDKEKLAALRDGLGDCATELINLGLSVGAVEDALEAALNQAEAELDSLVEER
jgi:hypothetical protein